jgi:hypothetical protein
MKPPEVYFFSQKRAVMEGGMGLIRVCCMHETPLYNKYMLIKMEKKKTKELPNCFP